MKITKAVRLKFLVIAFVAVILGYFGYDYFAFSYKMEDVPYKSFFENAEKGYVEDVLIRDDCLICKDATTGVKFRTQNPHSPVLEEELLRMGISVTFEKSTTELVTFIFDILFYVIFFSVVLVLFNKFISPNTFKIVRKTGVSFKDIVGMNELKNDMMQVADIMKNPLEYAKKGIRLPKGILLEGKPGNGKTLFARALATESKVNFIATKATDFESMFMAIGPAKVKLLFKKARRHAPCIVFIDEFDGIGTKRNYSGSAIETENTRIVTALLNELDGFTPNNGILVIAATNSRKVLDEALIRPGRFDAQYEISFPGRNDRIELIAKILARKKFDEAISFEKLADMFNEFSFAQIESVLNRASLISVQRCKTVLDMEDVKEALKVL